MNRLKLLATATLMALTFTACDEGTTIDVEPPPPPTPVGTISGTVTIEGTAASGITATLSSGATTTTGSGGSFAFSGVDAGTYTVTISGFPEDATFAEVTQSATISTDGQNVQLNFAGEYIRSSAVIGNVVAADAMMSGGDGQPETLVGVTVTLGGEHAMGETMETAEDGGFAFTGLRAGTYTVTISDFPEDVSFETVSLEIEVGVGEVGSADFTGHFIRTSAVEGQVVIEGEGLAGITVTLAGGPADESYTTMTDADGMYRFEELRPGDYTVSISDFDTRDYEFAATSQDVSVDLDETGTVSFTGVLLRTSGIAGRVSVEGMGLGGIEVTLSGAADASAMTDDGGQYAFAGLAAGDYTVSIAVESDAYVFESMSADLTLGDDESAIQNFEGAHARTASVSGMAFLDEAAKNDMFDEGEHPLAHAGLPVALVGPGVNEQRVGATDENGQFSFTGLRAGPYQLILLIDATVAAGLAANDVAYGGPATGYDLALGVGEAASQAIPFDITHTTVNFTVSLRQGDEMGAALPGATVTLYADAAGETRVGGGETGDDGSVAIKVARAGTSGNMVMAGVSADGYDVADGMTEVSWDPQMFATAAGNSNDIVNMNVDVTFGGRTISTAAGGGAALAGWAVSVTSGGEAVAGAPAALDDDGMAALAMSVDAVPASFTFAVADDQDDSMDGGESYSGASVEYTHDGLMLAGTMDAGMIEVGYTTQTLKVYVHHERDQVHGYTGNVLGGDVRMSGMLDIGIAHIDDNGRERSFASVEMSDAGGTVTFTGVPADANVIVQADEAVDGIMLLGANELPAYRNLAENGVTGGAFGEMGGVSHTVELCPLEATEPAGQDFGECATFAYVTTHNVSGQVTKQSVAKSGEGFDAEATVAVAGITVNLTPVEGKNLAGEAESFTTAEADDEDTAIDETRAFDFGAVAAGAYSLGVPGGWEATMAGGGAVGDAFSPLGESGDVALEVMPSTGAAYGRITGDDGFALGDVTVTVNGMADVTDHLGRYIVDGYGPVNGKVYVTLSAEGWQGGTDSTSIAFVMNDPQEMDLTLSAVVATPTASISGTVRASGTNAPIANAEITVTGSTVTNLNDDGKLMTGADGTYTATVVALDPGQSVTLSASKDGMAFVPASLSAPAHAGAEISGIDFTGFVNATITGRVVAPGGGPMAGATITATSATDATATFSATTGVTGTFSISVPFGAFTLSASTEQPGVVFTIPAAYETVNVAPGQVVNIGSVQAATAMAMGVSAVRLTERQGADSAMTYTGTVTVRWTESAEDVPTGYSDATYTLQTNTGTDGAWEAAASADVPADSTGYGTFDGSANDGEFMVRVVATATNDATVDPQHAESLVLNSGAASIGAIDPAASAVSAARSGDTIKVNWSATNNANSGQRVVIQVSVASLGGATVWFVAANGTPATIVAQTRAWSLVVGDTFSESWTSVDGAAVTVAAADLNNAVNVAVETVQGTVSEDNPRTRSAVMAVAAKPSS